MSELLAQIERMRCRCSNPYCGEAYVIDAVIDIIKEHDLVCNTPNLPRESVPANSGKEL